MNTRNRRIFVSAPRTKRLEERLYLKENFKDIIEFKKKIYKKIESLKYKVVRFGEKEAKYGIAASKGGWTIEAMEEVVSQCVGAVIIGIPFWQVNKGEGHESNWLPTEYCHYEGAVAHKMKLPILAISVGIESRVVFEERSSTIVVEFPEPNPKLLDEDEFNDTLKLWENRLNERRDIFLGYCSLEMTLARELKNYLESKFNVSVLDWKSDFTPGRTILEEVEYAASVCSTGIFLFTEDDEQGKDLKEGIYVPRDNVVFEAGYFINAKGNNRVMIIRKGNTKMPADLGGKIYPELKDESGINSIKHELDKFIENRLGPERNYKSMSCRFIRRGFHRQ